MYAEVLDKYRVNGYTEPVDVFSTEEVAEFRRRFFAGIGQTDDAAGPVSFDICNWHMRHRWCYEMAVNPKILDLVEGIFDEPNLILWSMIIWYKEPNNDLYVPWHQDGAYWPMTPHKAVTAWVALGDTFAENGGLTFIPGYQDRIYEHPSFSDPQTEFIEKLGDDRVDAARAVPLTVKAGQVCLFNLATIHSTGFNRTGRARVGCAFRYTTPDVKFHLDQWTRYKPELCVVRGEDRLRMNRAAECAPPAA